MKRSHKYHVFISHVVEDKAAVADFLDRILRAAGFKVWYSGSDLAPGDKLEDKIPEIITQCRYAIAIISSDYFKSQWAAHELSHLMALEKVEGRKIVLPIWHQVSSADIRKHLPFQDDNFALNTRNGLEPLVPKLIAQLRKRRPSQRKSPPALTNKSTESILKLENSGMSVQGNTIIIKAKQVSGRDTHITKN